MRNLIGILFSLILVGCHYDPISEAHREAKAFLNQKHTNIEIIEFLDSYIGEAPGAERYAVFVNWGVDNQEQFVEIMNHPKVTKRIMDIVVYKISDMGQSEKYCKIYVQRKTTNNEKHIRKSLLGCKYGL
jgi:hypothetical protein